MAQPNSWRLALPVAITTLAVAATAVLFQHGAPTTVRGASTWDELDFVPPSPAPILESTTDGSRRLSGYEPQRPVHSVNNGAPPALSTTPSAVMIAPPASRSLGQPLPNGRITAGTPTVHRHVSSAINAAVGASPRKGMAGSTTTSAGVVPPRNASAPSASSMQRVSPLGSVPMTGGVVNTSHLELLPSEEPPKDPKRFSIIKKQVKEGTTPAVPASPLGRTTPPSITGSHLGLLPGETATERSLRLMSAIEDLEQQVQNLAYENATLNAAVKERDDKLQLAIKEVRATRKDLVVSREDLERLKREVDALRDKVRTAEKDNAAVLQTMAPLLQQLLEDDDLDAASPERTE
jgi:hypothetical protein